MKTSKTPIERLPERTDRHQSALVILATLLVATYLTANIMAVKVITIFGMSLFDAGTITFPLSYLIGDVITEIYGFNTTKKVIWLTFFCNILLAGCAAIGILLPYPAEMADVHTAYATIFTIVPRITAASLVAFVAGEMSNAHVMVKLKEKTGGKHLWVRTIGSSAVGYLLDTVIFVLLAFSFVLPAEDLLTMIVAQYFMKLLIEGVCGTPLAYVVIGWIQRDPNRKATA